MQVKIGAGKFWFFYAYDKNGAGFCGMCKKVAFLTKFKTENLVDLNEKTAD